MDEQTYSNIRDILGELIGKKLVDITQHDKEEYDETQDAYIMLMFEDGCYLKFYVDERGLHHNCGPDQEEID